MTKLPAAAGLKTWIVVNLEGRPMTDEMTMEQADKWAQNRNMLLGHNVYGAKYVGI